MRFAYPDDLRGEDATLSSTVAPMTDYPLSAMHDGVPTEVAQWEDGSTVRVVWDFGGALSLQGVVITGHALEEGVTLQVAGNGADAWGAPAYSTNVIAPAREGINRPKTLAVDLSGTLMDTTGYRYASLNLPAQTAAHVLGEVQWVTTWQDTEGNQRWNFIRGDVRNVRVNETSYGVRHVVEPATWRRRLVMDMILNDDDRDLIMALFRQAGTKRPWPLVLTPTSIIDEALFGTFDPNMAELQETQEFLNFHVITFTYLELERGIF